MDSWRERWGKEEEEEVEQSKGVQIAAKREPEEDLGIKSGWHVIAAARKGEKAANNTLGDGSAVNMINLGQCVSFCTPHPQIQPKKLN